MSRDARGIDMASGVQLLALRISDCRTSFGLVIGPGRLPFFAPMRSAWLVFLTFLSTCLARTCFFFAVAFRSHPSLQVAALLFFAPHSALASNSLQGLKFGLRFAELILESADLSTHPAAF